MKNILPKELDPKTANSQGSALLLELDPNGAALNGVAPARVKQPCAKGAAPAHKRQPSACVQDQAPVIYENGPVHQDARTAVLWLTLLATIVVALVIVSNAAA